MTCLKDAGFLTAANKKELEDSKANLEKPKQKLRNLIKDAEKQRKRRAEKKQIVSSLADKSPESVAKLGKFMNPSSGTSRFAPSNY